MDENPSTSFEPPVDPVLRARMKAIVLALSEALPRGVAALTKELVGDTVFLRRIDNGFNYTVARYDLLMSRASAIWPDDRAPWPADIPRPAPAPTMHLRRSERTPKASHQGETVNG